LESVLNFGGNLCPVRIVRINIAPLEYQQVTLHRKSPSRLPDAGRVGLPSQMMSRYETI